MSEPRKNKVRNEEFKIWKKSIPSLYQHISSFKPAFTTLFDNSDKIPKAVTFSHKIEPDREKGILNASLLCSQGSEVFEVEFQLPLGLHTVTGDLPEPQFDPNLASMAGPVSPRWIYQGETIIKLEYIGGPDADFIAMASNGSLAWFKEECKVPVYVMAEMMGPSTSYSMIHTQKARNEIVVDFASSVDGETVVKSQQSMTNGGRDEHSILKLVDNSQSPGELLRTIHIKDTTVTHTVKFHDNHLFSVCSDDNRVRFYDTRGDGLPLWSLTDVNSGKLTCFDVSHVVQTLFITGSSTGVLKLWDLRTIASAMHAKTEPMEIVSLYHSGGDSVADVQFNPSSPSEFISVGGSGNVYHWDLEYVFARDGEHNGDELMNSEELQQQCLKFLHTGGGRRSIGSLNKRGTVAVHPIVDGVVGCVDADGLLTVYKPFIGRDGSDEEESEVDADADADLDAAE
ncbi:LAMI_0H05930g1_1 [Lachancea mirantina]|uniref:LAMI_0H05930g1_1 n=1 Tax=Lachancea mirantina TaxID=1230905 RepID=A0A1G4KF79_9SACH|nr:LAMI_0H05930g1_1 [Lachancea mirantina]